jgi:plasmanylethanolamine desaturase
MGERLDVYERKHRWLETAALAVFAGLATACALRMADVPASTMAIAVLTAWLATDFFSGLVHWAGDTWGSIRSPVIGAWFIRPFREHHDDPRAMTLHDFIETNGSSAIAGLPLLIAALFAPDDWAFVRSFLLFLALGGVMANQCHKWAHAMNSSRPRLVVFAQRAGLILRPELHRRHHARPHDSYYCTASGWMNGVLEAAGFFRACERTVKALTRAEPRRSC